MWFWLAMVTWGAAISLFAFNRTLVPHPSTRFLMYLPGIPVVGVIAGTVVVALDDCPDVGDCDMAGVAGFFVAAAVIVVGFGAVVLSEGVRAFLRITEGYEKR